MDDNTVTLMDENSVNVDLTSALAVNPIISIRKKNVQFTKNLNS